MTYDRDQLGPALRVLRESRGLKQADVARAIGRSGPNVSRLERAGANPQAASLLAYLEAIGATLADLHQELDDRGAAVAEALDRQVAEGRARLADEPSYRRMARDLLERYGGPELPPGLRGLADLVDEQEARLDDHDAQLRELERRLAPGGEQGGAGGSDRGPVEG